MKKTTYISLIVMTSIIMHFSVIVMADNDYVNVGNGDNYAYDIFTDAVTNDNKPQVSTRKKADDKTKKNLVGNTKIKTVKKKKSKAKVSLKKVKYCTGYQIKYSTSKKFAKKKTKMISIKKSSVTIKKLKKGKRYYFKARAYMKQSGKIIYGSWSNIVDKK